MRVHALNVMVFVLVCRTTCVRVVYWNIQEDAIVYIRLWGVVATSYSLLRGRSAYIAVRSKMSQSALDTQLTFGQVYDEDDEGR